MRSAKDGEPYFCEACGAAINSNCGFGSGYCRLESREVAQKRKAEWVKLEIERAAKSQGNKAKAPSA